MTQLASIIEYLDDLLDTKSYYDSSLNGLQVENPKQEINTVALAVDAGESVIRKAVTTHSAALLIVHHGLLWDEPQAITGALARKLCLLFEHGCSLYASHLPLDGNTEVGNAFELGRFVGITEIEPFLQLNGSFVGAKGNSTLTLREFSERLKGITAAITPLVLSHGNDSIRRVGIVTGSGAFAIRQCAKEGLDLLISGEPKQEVFHLSKELGVNAIFAGHYATETFGVRAIGKKLEERFGLQTVFIDEPTGI